MTALDDTLTFDADDVRWDVETLLPDGGVDGLLDEAAERAAALTAQRKGTVAGLSAAALADLLREMESIEELGDRAASYAGLRQAVDMSDPANGARLAKVTERLTAINNTLLWTTLEWANVPDETVDALLVDAVLAPWEHYLRASRRYRPHLMTEGEEQVMSEKSVTGFAAFSRLFGELMSQVQVDLDGASVTLEAALSRLASPERATRQSAAAAVTAALAPGLRTRAYIFNTLMADKAATDRLRKYPTWISSRNLSNEASDESVDALVDAVVARYDLPQRWYALKAKLLGVDRLADYDRMASVVDTDRHITFAQGRELVLDAYAEFSTELADVARRFFDEGWIDAPTQPGKRNGAFCSYTVPSHHPYVFLNWTYQRRDVLTLAHELGHGAHAYLARPQGVLQQSTGLTLAETASVFGESLTFARLLEQAPDANERLSLLAESIEGAIATVFRQTAMNRFEHAVHTHRRDVGELDVETFNRHWYETQSAMLGDAVEITDGYRTWWSYIPHFIGSPGYVYAYSYGQLLAMSVYRRYQQQGSDFVSNYLHLLSLGGSKPPEALAMTVGCDLTDPGFWDGGLALVEEQLHLAEEAAVAAGRI